MNRSNVLSPLLVNYSIFISAYWLDIKYVRTYKYIYQQESSYVSFLWSLVIKKFS
jgi:hypothetical protein